MNSDLVYTTSGLLIKKNDHYAVYEKNATPLEQIFSRSTIASSELAVLDFYKTNEIYTSLQANRLYMNYVSNPTYDNYIELVNFATDIFRETSCREFFENQAASLHISPMTLMLCRDIINGNLTNYLQYAGIPANSRFMINNGMTTKSGNEKIRAMFKETTKGFGSLSWASILTPIVENQGVFVTMFKHFFVDYY